MIMLLSMMEQASDIKRSCSKVGHNITMNYPRVALEMKSYTRARKSIRYAAQSWRPKHEAPNHQNRIPSDFRDKSRFIRYDYQISIQNQKSPRAFARHNKGELDPWSKHVLSPSFRRRHMQTLVTCADFLMLILLQA
nr:hypothetical protein CFP56_00455 [Quercus suber]